MEMAQLDKALAEAAEHGGALFVSGAVGIGKSALLDVAASDARSRGYSVLTVTGLESEADLPFAGLHQLLQPVLPSVGALPGPQKNALLTALGMRAGAPPEGSLDHCAHRHHVSFRDDVLLYVTQVREGGDDRADQPGEIVATLDCAQGAAVPLDVGRHVVRRSIGLMLVERRLD
jgi:hypothetical protein